MSATTIYWYPMGSGNVETITLPFITSLEDDDPEVEAATSETIGGGMYRQLYGDWRRIVITRQHLRPDDATEAETIRGLRSLQSHLIAGYSVGIAVGAGATFGAFTVAGIGRGAASLGIPANTYGPWDPSAVLSAGDEVVLQSPSPDGAREVHTLSTVMPIGSTFFLGLTRGTRYDHPGPILVRRRTFYPHLKLPEDQLGIPIITSSTRGRTYDMRLELREDMQETWDTGTSGEVLAGATGQARRSPIGLRESI